MTTHTTRVPIVAYSQAQAHFLPPSLLCTSLLIAVATARAVAETWRSSKILLPPAATPPFLSDNILIFNAALHRQNTFHLLQKPSPANLPSPEVNFFASFTSANNGDDSSTSSETETSIHTTQRDETSTSATSQATSTIHGTHTSGTDTPQESITTGPHSREMHTTSEVLGMLAFLRVRDKGNLPRRQTQFEVEREISMPLSAETFGWMQQDSQEALSVLLTEHRQTIPIRELDNPPDSSDTLLP